MKQDKSVPTEFFNRFLKKLSMKILHYNQIHYVFSIRTNKNSIYKIKKKPNVRYFALMSRFMFRIKK